MHDLNDMYYFAKIIEHGGFMAASRALNIPASRLSRRIKELENTLDTQLLHRSTRKLALTDMGIAFLSHCQKISAEAYVARDEIDQAHTSPRGTIKVCTPMVIAQFLLANHLADFIDQYPEVNVVLDVTNRQVNLIEDGFDVALRIQKGALDDSSLIMRTLGKIHTVLVASPNFLIRYGTPKTPRDLITYPMLSLNSLNDAYPWRFTSNDKTIIDAAVKPRLFTDDMIVLWEVALAGRGMVALPLLFIHDELKQKKLVRVLPDWHLPEGLIHAVYPSRRGLLPAIRVFLDFLLDNIRKQAGDFDVHSDCLQYCCKSIGHKQEKCTRACFGITPVLSSKSN